MKRKVKVKEKSRGARYLRTSVDAVGGYANAGRQIEHSRSSIEQWCIGRCKPNARARIKMYEVWNIPIEAWDT